MTFAFKGAPQAARNLSNQDHSSNYCAPPSGTPRAQSTRPKLAPELAPDIEILADLARYLELLPCPEIGGNQRKLQPAGIGREHGFSPCEFVMNHFGGSGARRT